MIKQLGEKYQINIIIDYGENLLLHSNNFVEITISDTGTGIKAEDIPTLFKIDTRHSMPGTSGEKGTGLGLILCQEFIELNKGKLWVESQIGHGSVFKFTLPFHLNECESI